jgi:phasin
MYEKPQYEIPEAVRQMTERNLDQARTAYSQFMEMAKKAQDMVAKSSGVMAESARDIQQQVFRFTEQNMEAGFQLASDLARARDLKEYLEIQGRHAQKQMQTYAQQAQEIGKMMADAAQRAQPKP